MFLHRLEYLIFSFIFFFLFNSDSFRVCDNEEQHKLEIKGKLSVRYEELEKKE